MEEINSIKNLKSAIQDLEYKQSCEWVLLKEQFNTSYESLKPMNLVKSKLKEMILAPDLKTNVINSVIGFATGFIAKKVVVGKTHNPLMKLVGFAVEMAVANKVTRNPEGIKSIAVIIFKKFLSGKTYSGKL
jgi:hypothetical protein